MRGIFPPFGINVSQTAMTTTSNLVGNVLDVVSFAIELCFVGLLTTWRSGKLSTWRSVHPQPQSVDASLWCSPVRCDDMWCFTGSKKFLCFLMFLCMIAVSVISYPDINSSSSSSICLMLCTYICLSYSYSLAQGEVRFKKITRTKAPFFRTWQQSSGWGQ